MQTISVARVAAVKGRASPPVDDAATGSGFQAGDQAAFFAWTVWPTLAGSGASLNWVSAKRVGLASYAEATITQEDAQAALSRGVNFLNWQGLAEGPSRGDAISETVAALGAERSSVVVCAQFGARTATEAASELRAALAVLGSDYVDVLTVYYVEQLAEWTEITSVGGSLPYLRDAQRDGVVRRIGVTSHHALSLRRWRRAASSTLS